MKRVMTALCGAAVAVAMVLPLTLSAVNAPRIDSSLQALDWFLRQAEGELAQIRLLLKSASAEQRRKSEWQGKLLLELQQRIDRIRKELDALPFAADLMTQRAIDEVRTMFARYVREMDALTGKFEAVKVQAEYDKLQQDAKSMQMKIFSELQQLQQRYKKIDEKQLQQQLVKEVQQFAAAMGKLTKALQAAGARLKKDTPKKDDPKNPKKTDPKKDTPKK